MTEFERAGHHRTNAHGLTYWVNKHTVNREIWPSGFDRDGSHSSWIADSLADLRASHGATSRYVDPNATCPVCGADVFFYQNESGSRVYFDELGPPWPKHPCTDQPSATIARQDMSKEPTTPAIRRYLDRLRICLLLSEARIDREYEFGQVHDAGPWQVCTVRGRYRSRSRTLLVLSTVDHERARYRYASASRLARCVTPGAIVFAYGQRLSYFDIRTMTPVEIFVEPFSGPTAFIAALHPTE